MSSSQEVSEREVLYNRGISCVHQQTILKILLLNYALLAVSAKVIGKT